MPAKSAKQYRFMQAILHNSKGLRGGDSKAPPKSVARHFVDETSSEKRKQFAKK